MRTPAQASALRQARQRFVANGQCPEGSIDGRLARSWQRSLEAGLLPAGRFECPDPLESPEIAQLRLRHQALLATPRLAPRTSATP